MMEKSLSYTYAEGGEVPYKDPHGRAYLSYEAVDDPNKFKYTMYNYEGQKMQSGVQDRMYLNSLLGKDTINTGGNVRGLQMVAPITDPNNIQVIDQAGRDRIVSGDLDYSYMAPQQEAGDGQPAAPKTTKAPLGYIKTAAPTYDNFYQLPDRQPTAPAPDYNLGMGDVASAFAQEMRYVPPEANTYDFTVRAPEGGAYVRPVQRGLGSIFDGYLMYSNPIKDVFNRPGG
jgi:hypothetical protein